MRYRMRVLGVLGFLLAFLPAAVAQAPSNAAIRYVAGLPVTFATHDELASYHFLWGPSDGTFGAIPVGGGTYTFYGTGASVFACARTSGLNAEGVFRFTGTLDHMSGGDGCKKLFGPNPGPAGWSFAKDYAGGGQLLRFTGGGTSGWLMPFHGEYHWDNPLTPNHKCYAGLDCFYSTLGLAVSIDGGQSFKVVGIILQPSQPRSVFVGGGNSMAVGYGSFVIADANGKHLDNPPPDPSSEYIYLFYTDAASGLRGACTATATCAGVARASYGDVVSAALSGDPHKVARLFRKYDGASPDPWTQPAASDTPDGSGTAGTFAPLWTDEPGTQVSVLYDRVFDVYLAAYAYGGYRGIKIRASRDLIHWSPPVGAPIQAPPGQTLYAPTLLGETGDPTIGGPAPRLYFSRFGAFPNWKTSSFESVTLTLSTP